MKNENISPVSPIQDYPQSPGNPISINLGIISVRFEKIVFAIFRKKHGIR